MITISGNCLLAYAKKGKYLNQKQSLSFTAVFKQQSWRIPDHPCATGEDLSSRQCAMYAYTGNSRVIPSRLSPPKMMQSCLSGSVFLAGLEKPAQFIFEACGMFAHKSISANCQC